MKATFERRALSATLKILGIGNQQPGVIVFKGEVAEIQVRHDKESLYLTAQVLCKCDAGAEIMIDLSRLQSFAESGSAPELIIDWADTSGIVASGKSKWKIGLFDPRTFARPEEIIDEYQSTLADPGAFIEALKLAAKRVPKTSASTVIDGVLIDATDPDGRTAIVGTNGRRLLRTFVGGLAIKSQIVISPKTIEAVAKMLGGHEDGSPITVGGSDRHFRVSGAGISLSALVYNQPYPNYRAILDNFSKEPEVARLVAVGASLRSLFKRALVAVAYSDAPEVTFVGEPDGLRLLTGAKSNPEFEEPISYEEIGPSSKTIKPFTSRYNIEDLAAIVGDMDEEAIVEIAFTEGANPVSVTSPASPGLFFMGMPFLTANSE